MSGTTDRAKRAAAARAGAAHTPRLAKECRRLPIAADTRRRLVAYALHVHELDRDQRLTAFEYAVGLTPTGGSVARDGERPLARGSAARVRDSENRRSMAVA